MQVTPHNWCQVPPFGHPGILARLTTPPGLSRPPTSFIGSMCQGIHRSPSATRPQRCSHPLYNSQTTTQPPPTPTTHKSFKHEPNRIPTVCSLVKDGTRRYRNNNRPHRGTWLFFQDPTGCLC